MSAPILDPVEAAAKAMYASDNAHLRSLAPLWDGETGLVRDAYRRRARTALTAAVRELTDDDLRAMIDNDSFAERRTALLRALGVETP